MGACQLTYLDSRDDTAWYDFINPLISSFMTEATSMVGQQWTQAVMTNASTDATLVRNAARVPQALSRTYSLSTSFWCPRHLLMVILDTISGYWLLPIQSPPILPIPEHPIGIDWAYLLDYLIILQLQLLLTYTL